MNKLIKEKIDVKSSAIVSVVYNCDSKEMYVMFISGAEYMYKNVEYDVFLGLKYSDSMGKYFNRAIKDKYDYEISKHSV